MKADSFLDKKHWSSARQSDNETNHQKNGKQDD